jgi:hypothetical protein
LSDLRSSRGHPKFAVSYCDHWENPISSKF